MKPDKECDKIRRKQIKQSQACPRCKGSGDDSVEMFSESELKYAGKHVCGFCGGTGKLIN